MNFAFLMCKNLLQTYNNNMQKNIKTIYIIGIGGISLSALARFLKKDGYEVLGSDICESEILDELRQEGFEISIGENKNFVERADEVIYTSAVSEDNGDIKFARSLGKVINSRAQVLGRLSKKYKTISVAGTHGKTTTTGMIANVFLVSNKKPNIHIGGILNNINSNYFIGDSDVLVTEACEYKDSFLELQSHVSIVLNLKPDHLDYFKNIDNIFSSFSKFVQKTSKNGVFIYNFDDFLANKLKFCGKSISFGLNEKADVYAKNITEYEKGRFKFDLFYKGDFIENIFLPCFGKHNIYNALACASVCLFYGFEPAQIKKGLEDFKGIKRRFEEIKKEENLLVIHDYAHHPDEIKATLIACRNFRYKKLVLIFQPHTFSRTKDFYNEFIKSFSLADEIWLLPIYPAREKPIRNITSKKLCDDAKNTGLSSKYFNSFQECKENITLFKNDNILFAILGAGDIDKLAYSLR